MYFGGNVRGESAMNSEEEVGSLIEYEFRVRNMLIICSDNLIINGKDYTHLLKGNNI